MRTPRAYLRALAPVVLITLAACQTAPVENASGASAPASAPAAASAAENSATQGTRQGAPVAVFLSDHQIQPGWTPVPAPSGTLYVEPQPFLTRADLRELQVGGTEQGQGVLSFELNPNGVKRTLDVTTEHPNKVLTLVIGRTMVSIMPYSQPISDGRLVFLVNNQENAVAAARAIAGAPADASATDPAANPATP